MELHYIYAKGFRLLNLRFSVLDPLSQVHGGGKKGKKCPCNKTKNILAFSLYFSMPNALVAFYAIGYVRFNLLARSQLYKVPATEHENRAQTTSSLKVCNNFN